MKENAFETIETFMADHLKDALDEQYFILAGEAAAICEKIAYRQGLRDLLKTLFAEEA